MRHHVWRLFARLFPVFVFKVKIFIGSQNCRIFMLVTTVASMMLSVGLIVYMALTFVSPSGNPILSQGMLN